MKTISSKRYEFMVLLILSVFILSNAIPANADSGTFQLSALLGGTTDVGVSSEAKTSTGLQIGSANVTNRASYMLGVDGRFMIPTLPIGIAAIYEHSNDYSSDSSPSDTENLYMAMPLVYRQNGKVNVWGGFGIGFVSTGFGQSSIVSDGITLTTDTGTTSFAISPRVGADYSFTDDFTGGIQAAYVYTAGSVGWTAIGSKSTLTGSSDFSIHWFSFAVRMGVRF